MLELIIMKMKKHTLRLALLFTVFAMGISAITIWHNKAPVEVNATQHVNNYNLYSYSGSYYNSLGDTSTLTDGQSGTLRTKLTTLIFPDSWTTYSSGLGSVLQEADEDPTNSANMVYLYTRDSVKKNAASSWNREHVWPKSLSNSCWKESQAGTDILHLRPTYNTTNSTRSSKLFSDVAHNSTTLLTYSNGMNYGYSSGNYFEPLDTVKGDVARIIMYIWVAYYDYYGSKLPSIKSVFKDFDTLLTWHMNDKPDLMEGNRNDYVQTESVQHNRNPFVDHPEYAWRIFGSQASSSVKNSCMEVYPAAGYTPDPSGDDPSGGDDVTSDIKLATSIEVGDIVLLTANGTAKQFNGISNTSTKYGVASDYSGETPDAAIAPLQVVQGYNSSTLAFKYDNKYLTWSSGNSLDVNNSITQNSSWTISFNGTTPIIANANDSSRLLQYNSGSPRFACYSTSQNNVSLWKVETSGGIDSETPTGISLDNDFLQLTVGGEITLSALLTPVGAEGTISWTSDNESVATVTQNGKVTAIDEGTATITATCGNLDATCDIEVIGASDLSNHTFNLSINQTSTLSTTEISWTATDVGSIVCQQEESSVATNNYVGGVSGRTSTRFYKDSVLTITPDEGTTIHSVEFSATSSEYASALKGSSWQNASSSLSGTKVIIEPNNGANEFSTTIGGTCGFTAITIYYSREESGTDTIEDYLNRATSYATIHGRESLSSLNFDFSQQGYSTGEKITNVTLDSNIVATCSKGNGTADPAYYSTGTSLRLYGSNTITFAPSIGTNTTIIQIEFTFDSSNNTGLTLVGNNGSYNNGVWKGSSNSITFTYPNSSGHVRIKKVSVSYYVGSASVSNIAIRFGASISKTNWDAINNLTNEDITDYGVMMVRESTLVNTYGKSLVKDAYAAKKTLAIINKGNGSAPYILSGVYSFTARVSDIGENDYNSVICAAPYIVVGSQYYFLAETRFSVKSLARHYIDNPTYMGGSSLSNQALTILAGD